MKPYQSIFIIILCNWMAGAGTPVAASVPPYLNDSLPMEERIDDALARMTLEEKNSIDSRSFQIQLARCAPDLAFRRYGRPTARKVSAKS